MAANKARTTDTACSVLPLDTLGHVQLGRGPDTLADTCNGARALVGGGWATGRMRWCHMQGCRMHGYIDGVFRSTVRMR